MPSYEELTRQRLKEKEARANALDGKITLLQSERRTLQREMDALRIVLGADSATASEAAKSITVLLVRILSGTMIMTGNELFSHIKSQKPEARRSSVLNALYRGVNAGTFKLVGPNEFSLHKLD